MIRHEVMVNGTMVRYWVLNPELSETIVAIHGFRGNHRALVPFASNITRYRVIMPDLPGCGESEPLNVTHTLVHYAQFLESFLRELAIDSCALWGHSYGGTLCVLFAAQHPDVVSKMVLVSPAMQDESLLAKIAMSYYSIALIMPKRLQRQWVLNPIMDRVSAELLIKDVSRRRKHDLITEGKRNLLEMIPQVILESSMSFFNTDMMAYARRVSVDTLVVAGNKDQLVSVRRIETLLRTLPDAEAVFLANQGHLSPLEKPAHIAKITETFLEKESV